MAEVCPDAYRQLTAQPGFIFFKLVPDRAEIDAV